jgi:hypothetical protein
MKGSGFWLGVVVFLSEEQLTSCEQIMPKIKAKLVERYFICVVSFLEVTLQRVILLEV